MTDIVENLVCDLVEWVGRQERTYQEVMGAWRTSCPRLPVWEDATEHGLVETLLSNGRLMVRATPAGRAFLEERRPDVCADPQPGSGL
jgi:D-3-phosphoglycerate dehydrogenase